MVPTLHCQCRHSLHVAKEAVRDHLVKGGTVKEGKEIGVLGFAPKVEKMFMQTPELKCLISNFADLAFF